MTPRLTPSDCTHNAASVCKLHEEEGGREDRESKIRVAQRRFENNVVRERFWICLSSSRGEGKSGIQPRPSLARPGPAKSAGPQTAPSTGPTSRRTNRSTQCRDGSSECETSR